VELYSNLSLRDGVACGGEVGAGEAGAPARGEATLKYHPGGAVVLTAEVILPPDRGWWGV
jgi:hypothetical protein